MWQYTTETIINSEKGSIKGDKRFDVVDDKLLIEGVGSFDLKNIAAVYKTPYLEAQNAVHSIDFAYAKPANVEGEVLRLQIWVSEEGTICPELQNAFLMKKLPFHFEIVSTGDSATDVEKFVTLINRTFTKKGAEKLFVAAVSSKSNTRLVLTATDCYVRINKVQLVEVLEEQMLKGSIEDINQATLTALAGLGRANLTGYQNYTEIAVGKEEVRGREGNGTVARLVKNLRIPTKASLNPFGSDHGGKPVPGGEYDQYLIQYVVDRSHMGHQVVGSVADKSMTSHVLFIEKNTSAAFADMLKNANIPFDVTKTANADRDVKTASDMATVEAKGAEGPKPTKR
jgi:hypothetical protein